MRHFSLVVPTAYGQMLVNRNDINQTTALVRTGLSHDHSEIALLQSMLRLMEPGAVVLDVGANFGAFTLALAGNPRVPCTVHAFEPQRHIFHMLAGSVALNSLLNVHVHNVAVGDRDGKVEVPQFDYTQPLNFGSIEFGEAQREKLSQSRQFDEARKESVPVVRLDSMEFERVDILKIDVEGMEFEVLAGAEKTIERCQPVMLVEFIKVDREALRKRLAGFGYTVFNNKMNYLCVPERYRQSVRIEGGTIVISGNRRDASREP